MRTLRNKRRRRQEQLVKRREEFEEEKVASPVSIEPKTEHRLLESLLNPTLELPVQGHKLVEMSGSDFDNLPNILQKLNGQSLISLQSDGYTIVSINLESISRLIELANLSGRHKGFPRFKSITDELEYLLNAPSIRDKESRRVGGEIQELLNSKSYKEQLMIQMFQSAGGSQLREFCPQKTREDCRGASRSGRACPRLHFRRIIQSHTDESLGDCSFLNTCFHMETCKFVHYEIDQTQETEPRKGGAKPRPSLQSLGSKLVPPQWLNCDLRNFDVSVLGKFAVVMADPPWDIHMELPYGKCNVYFYLLLFILCTSLLLGTMSDDEMRQLDIPILQDEGYIFLWVTGRAMELGRECLTLWGYERIDELVWVKTNQLQRLIRTGRTGHWINHGKVSLMLKERRLYKFIIRHTILFKIVICITS